MIAIDIPRQRIYYKGEPLEAYKECRRLWARYPMLRRYHFPFLSPIKIFNTDEIICEPWPDTGWTIERASPEAEA